MIDGSNDETGVGERLGQIIKVDKGADSAVRDHNEGQPIAAERAVLCHG